MAFLSDGVGNGFDGRLCRLSDEVKSFHSILYGYTVHINILSVFTPAGLPEYKCVLP